MSSYRYRPLQFAVSTVFFGLLCLLVFGFSSNQAQAQFIKPGDQMALQFQPMYPGPNEEVVVSLSNYSLGDGGVSIRWYFNGEEVLQSRDNRSVTLRSGAVGDVSDISAVISAPGYPAITLRESLTVRGLDVIIESNSNVPAFYEGKALPSYGSQIRAVAMPDVGVDPARLSYKWQLDSNTLFGGTTRGLQAVTFDLPRYGEPFLTVGVYGESGELLTQESVKIEIVETEVLFYVRDALTGLNPNALADGHILSATEATIVAVPYYLNTSITQDLGLEWSVDGMTVVNPSTNPYELTIRNTGGTGSTRIGFDIHNRKALLQRSVGNLVINFQ